MYKQVNNLHQLNQLSWVSRQSFSTQLYCYSFVEASVLRVSLFRCRQSPEGVPVQDGPEDSLHDQLESDAPAGHHPPHRLLVPGGVDVCRLSESRQDGRSNRRGLHPRWSAVRHVPAGPLGLHDGCG